MPIFEYGCTSCGAETSALVRRPEDTPVRCPTCGAEPLERLLSVCSVRSTRVDATALHATARDFAERPERFGQAMDAFSARTGVKMDRRRVDDAMDRLSGSTTKDT